MRKHYLYNIQLLALLTAITACSSEESAKIDDASKTPIRLSVGVEGPQSRATVITDELADKEYSAFPEGTGIWMAMQSDYEYLGSAETPDDKDYKGDKGTKYCVTYGTTDAATGTVNPVNISGNQIRYWDDAHARSSALSIWAIAVPGKSGAIGSWSSTSGWDSSTNPTKTLDWSVATAQDATSIAANDLCFSNNKVDYRNAGTDRRMKFNKENSKFDEGKLVFYHALSKITIKMIAADGFKHDGTDFAFDGTSTETSAPVTLKGFSVSGTFDVADGAFKTSSIGTATTISSMYKAATSTANDPYYTLEALVMPGTNLSTANIADAVSFSLDGNAFKVSSSTLVEKLRAGEAPADWTTIEAGKNYIFTFRVSKTAIKVTATIKDWEVLNAKEHEPKININTAYGLEADGTTLKTFTDDFSFLKSTTINTGYTDEADAIYTSGAYSLSPAQYWPNHNTHYFFRGVWPLIGSATDGTKTLTTNVLTNAIKVNNVAYAKGKYPSDLMIGYPRTTTETCQAHGKTVATQGICATEGDIRMNFQYVMSKIEVNLISSNPGDKDYVTFDADTKVELVDAYTGGNILLSNGESDFTGYTKSTTPYAMHGDDTYKKFIDAVVPQTLLGDTDNIKFRVTVKSTDGWLDQYETLLGIKDIAVSINGTLTSIDTWEPGKHYVYTLKITKTGIKVTATIKDWIEASGSTTIWM